MATNETPDLESIQQALNKSDPHGINPPNASGSDPTLGEVQEKFSAITDSIDQFSGPDNELSLPEVQEKLAGFFASTKASYRAKDSKAAKTKRGATGCRQ